MKRFQIVAYCRDGVQLRKGPWVFWWMVFSKYWIFCRAKREDWPDNDVRERLGELDL